ncbi:MAG TPA: aspartyl protease family protein [Candidatus Paceibacterota bacterium]
MKFRYKRYGTIFRPVIPVILKNKDKSIGYHVLVDSGADMCLFHAEIAELIGIEVKKGEAKEVFGIGGKASIYYLHNIIIEVGGWTYEIEVGFMPEVSGRSIPYGVVGQNGFFDNFIVKFDLLKEEVELKARD